MKKEIPILFSTPMVQAILAGRKTQTRRLVKGESLRWLDESGFTPEFVADPENHLCPYGQPGDVLWVRESFRVNSWVPDDGEVTFRYEADGGISTYIAFDDEDGEIFNNYWIQSCDDLLKAGYESNDEDRFEDYEYTALRLRPNIFLRKEAARIWLEVTDVRVERLQDISEADAKAEGVDGMLCQYADGSGQGYTSWVESFKRLWAVINGADSWNANPWVWVVSFKVLSTTGKPELLIEQTTA